MATKLKLAAAISVALSPGLLGLAVDFTIAEKMVVLVVSGLCCVALVFSAFRDLARLRDGSDRVVAGRLREEALVPPSIQ